MDSQPYLTKIEVRLRLPKLGRPIVKPASGELLKPQIAPDSGDTITQMNAAGKTFEPETYEGAGHGFMRVGEAPEGSDANREARGVVWRRWDGLLAKLSS
jgi:hypothetical protein